MPTKLPPAPMLNPATCLALWMVLVVLALNVASPLNAGVMAIVAVTAWMVSPMQFRRLLRRSRWLLLAVTLVFLLLTPDSRTLTVFGVSIPGGVGLQLACDQLGRLVFVMAMLALLGCRTTAVVARDRNSCCSCRPGCASPYLDATTIGARAAT